MITSVAAYDGRCDWKSCLPERAILRGHSIEAPGEGQVIRLTEKGEQFPLGELVASTGPRILYDKQIEDAERLF
jgi:hypothetical protein